MTFELDGRRMRTCADCGTAKPLTRRHFYRSRNCPSGFGYRCIPCRKTEKVGRERRCLRCHEAKPGEAFDWGPSKRRRRGVCRECIAREGERPGKAPREWATFERRGETVRRCSRCRAVKPLTREHWYTSHRRSSTSWVQTFEYRCKACSREERRDRARVTRKPLTEEQRVKRAEAQRRYRERYPERVQEANRRHIERVRRDPVKRRVKLENDRIARALRRERRTGTMRVRSAPAMPYTTAGEPGGTLPAKPLADAIDRLVARDHRQLIGDEQSHAEAICGRLGLSTRSLRAWRGERTDVQLDVADRVLLAAGWHWWDVYDAETYGEEVAARAAWLLGGEQVAV